MTDRLITADARRVTPAEFLDHVLGPRRYSREEDAERAALSMEMRRRQAEGPHRKDDYWGYWKYQDALSAEYKRRLDEIAAKYALTEVEQIGPGRIAA